MTEFLNIILIKLIIAHCIIKTNIRTDFNVFQTMGYPL